MHLLNWFTHTDEDMSSPLKKERSKEFILVPSELVYKTDAQDDPDHESGSSSGDEISIHVESPTAVHDESLSSSAFTTVSTRPDSDDATATEDFNSSLRRSRVRFRSRVRITSGLHRRVSTTSSLTSSRSSSISAPLRSPLTAENCTPGWGTLGQRVGLFAISNRQAAQARNAAKQRARRRQGIADPPTENTALLGVPIPPGYDGYLDSDEEDDEDYSDEYDDEALLSRQIDLVFGKWPGRLLNRQVGPTLHTGCVRLLMYRTLRSGGGGSYSLSSVVVVWTSMMVRMSLNIIVVSSCVREAVVFETEVEVVPPLCSYTCTLSGFNHVVCSLFL